jgi:hypothetical protein
MKISLPLLCSSLLFLSLVGCNEPFEDTIPESFFKTQLNPDEIYIYSGGPSYGVRLDPLLNDSIKVPVNITYSNPAHGIISFIPNEGWYYKSNDGFIGVDQFNYTACYQGQCLSSSIKMHIEEPPDLTNCAYQLVGESVETNKNQPIEIRIFINDTVCQYVGNSIASPEKGTFKVYSYSGSIKNIVYVYFPPKGFIGTDRFKYKIFTPDGDMETYCTITIKE